MPDDESLDFSLEEFYDDYPRIEAELNAALAVSLNPRSPDFLYEVIGGLGFVSGGRAVDLGCGEGDFSLELARRFGFAVQGVDPVERHIEICNDKVAAEDEGVRRRVRFVPGSAERIPVESDSVDLVLCREMLYHVPVLESAFAECRRVLKTTGRVVIYQLFSTELLEPREAESFWNTSDTFATSADRGRMEAAIRASGLRIERDIELGSETGEWSEEQHGKVSRELLALSRMLREPRRYIDRFGRTAYDIKLGDARWHVFRMIGKLSNRIYVLAP